MSLQLFSESKQRVYLFVEDRNNMEIERENELSEIEVVRVNYLRRSTISIGEFRYSTFGAASKRGGFLLCGWNPFSLQFP